MLSSLVCFVLLFCSGGAILLSQKPFFDSVCDGTDIGLVPQANPWCTGGDPCDWSGVECASDGSVLVVDTKFDAVRPLSGSFDGTTLGAVATTATQIALCCGSGGVTSSLDVWAAANNTLEQFSVDACPGVSLELPSTSMPSLRELVVRSADLTGKIAPAFLDGTPLLKQLTLRSVHLTGTLPEGTFWASLQLLETLTIAYTSLKGSVPPDVCALVALDDLDLSFNRFDDFPACLGGAPLRTCNLRHNVYCTNSVPAPDDLAPCVILIGKEGLLEPDHCGVCGGDGTSCIGCDGEIDSGAQYDACGVCLGTTTDPELCPDCEGVAGGTKQIDACGVCGGDGTFCLDCEGVVQGTACYDDCDVCNGDGTSCRDCTGLVGGSVELDVCEVCGGDGTTCFDCKGVAGGSSVYDLCDVCGGDGRSCIDCTGVRFGTAEYDCCDVCDGDGKSCGLAYLAAQEGVTGATVNWIWTIALGSLLCCCVPLAVCFILGVRWDGVLGERKRR